jgi:hypothetical protein
VLRLVVEKTWESDKIKGIFYLGIWAWDRKLKVETLQLDSSILNWLNMIEF